MSGWLARPRDAGVKSNARVYCIIHDFFLCISTVHNSKPLEQGHRYLNMPIAKHLLAFLASLDIL